jgi:hypothetical protein
MRCERGRRCPLRLTGQEYTPHPLTASFAIEAHPLGGGGGGARRGNIAHGHARYGSSSSMSYPIGVITPTGAWLGAVLPIMVPTRADRAALSSAILKDQLTH